MCDSRGVDFIPYAVSLDVMLYLNCVSPPGVKWVPVHDVYPLQAGILWVGIIEQGGLPMV